MARVIMASQISLHPYAACTGDDPDPEAESNCPWTKRPGPTTVADAKAHAKDHPTHDVLVIHEKRTIYRAAD